MNQKPKNCIFKRMIDEDSSIQKMPQERKKKHKEMLEADHRLKKAEVGLFQAASEMYRNVNIYLEGTGRGERGTEATNSAIYETR
jgi:hypothetical protein